MSDLEYLTTGFFTSFFPNTEDGEVAYSDIISQNETSKILTRDLKTVLYQLRKAGYKVSKANKPSQTLEDIFKELDQLGI